MQAILRISRSLLRHLTVMLLASLFAWGLYQVWDLSWRWFLVCVGGVAMVAVAMCFARVFADFVLIGFMFVLPLMSFDKWFWPAIYTQKDRGNLVYGGMLGVGLLDFILVGLYISWFYRVFVARVQAFPRLCLLDWIIAGFLMIHVIGSIGAMDLQLALGATEYFLKYVLLYFYISRNLRREHLPWLMVAVCFAIVGEAAFGAYQHWTGKLLGFALDKGKGSSSQLSYQYSVPGLKSITRATGTCYDSHALGNFVAMLLPFPFVFMMTPWAKAILRSFCGLVFIAGLLIIYFSYSRSAWLSTAIGLSSGFILIITVWQEGGAVALAAITGFAVIASSPLTIYYVYDRFKKSPIETLTTRFKQWEVALTIWQRFPFFGTGPNNYLNGLKRYDYMWLKELPVHNVILQVLAELGLLGLVCYLGIFISAVRRLFRIIRQRSDFAGRIAMAALIGLITTLFDGLTDPLFREPNVFATFWLLIGMAVAIEHWAPAALAIVQEQSPPIAA